MSRKNEYFVTHRGVSGNLRVGYAAVSNYLLVVADDEKETGCQFSVEGKKEELLPVLRKEPGAEPYFIQLIDPGNHQKNNTPDFELFIFPGDIRVGKMSAAKQHPFVTFVFSGSAVGGKYHAILPLETTQMLADQIEEHNS
jgi:hypothetical protein